MSTPIFHMDLGPMFSGKTDELLRRCIKIADAFTSFLPLNGKEEKKVMLIVDRKQRDRETTSKANGITTHSSSIPNSKNLYVREVERLEEISNSDLEGIVLIGIDEAFYPDLYERIVYWYLTLRKSICIAAVDGSYQQTVLSPQLFRLIPYATKIVKHSAYCTDCIKEGKYIAAYYTLKEEKKNDELVEYGGRDLYKPVCFNHLI